MKLKVEVKVQIDLEMGVCACTRLGRAGSVALLYKQANYQKLILYSVLRVKYLIYFILF